MSTHMPPLSALGPKIWLSEEDVRRQKETNKREHEEILNYLSEMGRPQSARTDIPELGQHECCDTTVFEIFCRIVCNPCRLVKDAVCGCFPSCVMPEPKNKTYMPKHVYNRLRSADVYLNRNTCLLCCVTPVVLSSLPFCAFVPLTTKKLLTLNSLAGCSANDCSIFSAGCLTYFWSGDFGGRERNSYEELKVIYDDLADFLAKEWQEVHRTNSDDPLRQLCEKLRRNSPNIMKGLTNAGITALHAEDITKRLFEQIYEILKGTHFRAVSDLERSEPPQQPRLMEL